MKNRSKVFGIGVNDLPYAVTRYEKVDGKEKQVWICPFYACWKYMLGRVYNPKYKRNKLTYQNTSLHKDWLYCSNFKAWMETQDWEGLQLDKDILISGNKHYSPETCVFVPAYINSCLNIRANGRGVQPLGVHLVGKKFQAQLSEASFRYLGLHPTAQEAHKAWQVAKVGSLKKVLDKYSKETYCNPLVVDAITKRITKIENAIVINEEIKEL